jgi:3-hydroxyisobutyrate dehydrogenase-like beta-hydroxyacid dehydrogenase
MNLLKKGYPLSVWNRSIERAGPLVDAGATLAGSPRLLAAGSDVVVTMLSDPPALEAVYGGAEGLLAGCRKGGRFVDMSTIGPEAARGFAARVEACGGDFVEAPVTGSKAGAEQGTLVIMSSGRKEPFEAVLPILEAMGSKVLYVGGTGQASQLKLLGNLIIATMLEGFCEALVLGRKAGIEPETVIELVMSSGYASPYFRFKGDAIARRDFAQHFSIDLMHKDLSLLLASGTSNAVALPAGAAVREIYQAARGLGLGQSDICGTVEVLETLAGVKVGKGTEEE